MGRLKLKKGKAQKKKPRHQELTVTFGQAGSATVNVWANGAVTFVDADGNSVIPSHVQIGSFYERDSGKNKILTRTPGPPDAIHLDSNTALASYGAVFAVDTNTRDVRGVPTSASVCLMIPNITATPAGWHAGNPRALILEFTDARCSPEHIGWDFAVKNIETYLKALPSPQGVALVVDCDLDALPAINRREQPYFADQLLPNGFTLAYGSSDAGTTEFLTNRAIGMCNDIATHILDWLEENPLAGPAYQPGGDIPVAKWRVLQVTAERAP